ncbi:MAG TPA: hypothetical protein VNE58_10725 [Casimicrobiaceae bacterium]|nr:hypothetical protein [Casimicrobiaceae bacterium]
MLVSTYLFAWNPKLWDWPELPRDIAKLQRRGHLDTEWSSGSARNVEPGGRAFLMRLGVEPKGLYGAGTVMTPPVKRAHWRKALAAQGRLTNYVMLRLDTLLPLPIVTLDDLSKPPFGRFRWTVRQSGIRVPGPLAQSLEDLWDRRLGAARAQRGRRR